MKEFNSVLYRGFEVKKARDSFMVTIPNEKGSADAHFGTNEEMTKLINQYLDS